MLGTNVSTPTKIGFFGGSFDPIHLGHIAVIEQAVKGFGLEKFFCAQPTMLLFAAKNLFLNRNKD